MKPSCLTRFFDFLSPRTCVVCDVRLSMTEQVICARCFLHLPLTGFEKHARDNEMVRRFWGLINVEQAAALFFFEAQSALSRMIYDMKYHNRPDIGEFLGMVIARRFLPTGFFETIDSIVPVPLSRMRRRERGYNQSLMIARGVGRVTGLPVWSKVVVRTRFQHSQTHLSQWERQDNTAGVFVLRHPEAISGKHLLLVDDIVTTGATVRSLADELSKAGNMRFSILSAGYTKS